MERKELIKQLNDEFQIKHNKAIARAENNLASASKNPEFAKNLQQQKVLEFEIAKLKYEQKDASQKEAELKKCEAERVEILKKLKISPASLLPQYECKKCNDTGYANGRQCTCFKAKLNQHLIALSGLEPTTLTTFKNFDCRIAKDKKQQETLEKLKTVLLQYCDKFPYTPYSTIVLTGHTGVGKTFALECTASEIIKRGYTANFITAFQLNNQFLKYHTCFDANKQSYMDMLLLPDLLVIDDLGTEPILRNVTKEYLLAVIQERMLKHKATLISTNLNAEQIFDRYGERLFSRLTHKGKALLINIEGNDLRQR